MVFSLESAIQTFSCGGSRLPFGSGAIPFRETQLAAVSSHFLSGVPTTRRDARMFTKHVSCFRLVVVCVECVHLVRSPPSWCDTRVTCFSRFFVLCSCHFRLKAWFEGCTARRADHGTHVWTGQGHIFATLPYKRRAPSWIKLKPEDLSEQICKLAKKGMTPSSIGVTLRDSFGVPQVKMITGNKILRILKKEGLAPSIPEVLYFLVKKAKSMRKHLDKNRKDRDSKFRLILVESRIHRLARYYRRVKSLPANWKYVSATASTGTCDAPFGDECINFFGRSKRFRAKDHLPVPLESAIQTFLCGGSRLPFGSGAIPFRETLDCNIRFF